MKKKTVLITIAIFLNALTLISQETGTFKDPRNGKVYKTIKIGTQTWMAENLRYNVSIGCWGYNDEISNVLTYGYLYDWETAKKVCPSGWHLPSDAEWTTLTNYLGVDSIAGGKLKEIGTTHWASPNAGATNESGFTALPGGYRNNGGAFDGIGGGGSWWSSTESGTNNAWSWCMNYGYSYVARSYNNKANGFSVRCIKD
ncbi:MAG: hypothetical protein HXX09_15560 [Bacteroidetes bacterium]|nr:hypothetical protein [Bacteroidota bacterium]